ncbi:hypothetical protein [Marinobacterium stanieri]|uniref:hypothetical protein n=1 Tax=Marinobacterium stanieri TaxID=49186 RepID=UPI003A8F6714
MTDPQTIELIQLESIGQAEVIALRRMQCGFVVHPDGTEHKLDAVCEHLRSANQRPTVGGNFLDQAKRRAGAGIARKLNRHWCGACGCILAAKTMLGFDKATSAPAIYERGRCPLKKW